MASEEEEAKARQIKQLLHKEFDYYYKKTCEAAIKLEAAYATNLKGGQTMLNPVDIEVVQKAYAECRRRTIANLPDELSAAMETILGWHKLPRDTSKIDERRLEGKKEALEAFSVILDNFQGWQEAYDALEKDKEKLKTEVAALTGERDALKKEHDALANTPQANLHEQIGKQNHLLEEQQKRIDALEQDVAKRDDALGKLTEKYLVLKAATSLKRT